MNAVAEGDYDKRVAGDWPLEFMDMARSFNAMAGSVGRHSEALEAGEARYKELLEASLGNSRRLQQALDEKVVLLKEVHHRVKNNLQIVASLLNLQIDSIRDEADRDLFRTSQNRVYSISLTHELLYQASDFSSVEMSEYGERLLSYLRESEAQAGCRVEARLESFSLPLDKAMPCGLILNELVTNAIKHGGTEAGASGHIEVRMGPVQDEGGRRLVRIVVVDGGPGLPPGLDPHKGRRSWPQPCHEPHDAA